MVIVAGGIVLRLLYVDNEYRKRIDVIDKEPGTITHSTQTAQGISGRSMGILPTTLMKKEVVRYPIHTWNWATLEERWKPIGMA